MFVGTFLLRITHTIISQSSADSSWITLYIYICISIYPYLYLSCVITAEFGSMSLIFVVRAVINLRNTHTHHTHTPHTHTLTHTHTHTHTHIPPVFINGCGWYSAQRSPCKAFAHYWVSWRHFNESNSIPERAVETLLIFHTFCIGVGKKKEAFPVHVQEIYTAILVFGKIGGGKAWVGVSGREWAWVKLL